MTIPVQVVGVVRNSGKHDSFPYKDWSYPHGARNRLEGREAWTRNAQSTKLQGTYTNDTIEKLTEPNYLCFLADDGRIEISSPTAWRSKKERNAAIDYVLVSYTSKQFSTTSDWDYLHKVGKYAAGAAGVSAYWVDCSCLGSKSKVEKNVWQICDIIRGAHSLVIAVSGLSMTDAEGDLPRDLLRGWGSRVWTLPEILLRPGHKDVDVYMRGGGSQASDHGNTKKLSRFMARRLDLPEPCGSLRGIPHPWSIGTHLDGLALSAQSRNAGASPWRHGLCFDGPHEQTAERRTYRHFISGLCSPILGQ